VAAGRCRGARGQWPVQECARRHHPDRTGRVTVDGCLRISVDDERVVARLARRPHQGGGSVPGQVRTGVPGDRPNLQHLAVEYRIDFHRTHAVVVMDRDEIGKPVVAQCVGQPVEIYLLMWTTVCGFLDPPRGCQPWAGMTGRFSGGRVVRRGELSTYQLQKNYRPLYRNVYVPKQATPTALTRARAAWLWSGGDATLTGLSAAAVLGTKWIDAGRPAELNRIDRRCPPGIVVHSYGLEAREVCVVDRIRVTTPERTAFDIGRTLPQQQAIPILDALANATHFKVADVVALADGKPRARGVRQLRSLLPLVDGGAESPQESRVRLLLVRAGLPPPETQIEFVDEFGVARIRVDMGWREWKVAVEYDGVQHWSDRYQRSWDIDRIAMLESIDWVVVRVSAEILSRPHVIVERVVARLRAAGCPI
jgi:Protein of unknown function (DUF559)